MTKELRAVIFDLDGVITNTSEFHYEAWKRIASEIDIELTREFNERLKGVGRMESLDLILSLSNRNFLDEEKVELAERKNKYYLEFVNKIKLSDMLPGTLNCFNILKDSNIKMVLASASKNASKVIRLLEISCYFDYIVDAETVVKSKPDPEIFIKASGGIGVLPENCVGIEDAAAGILAIKACGMFSVGVGKKDELTTADICIKDFSEFNLEKIYSVGGFYERRN